MTLWRRYDVPKFYADTILFREIQWTLWRRYDVPKFYADAILFREIQCKKMDILMFKRRFQWGLG